MVKNNKSNELDTFITSRQRKRKFFSRQYTYSGREYTLMCAECFKLHDSFRVSQSSSILMESNTLPEELLEEFWSPCGILSTMHIQTISCCAGHTFHILDKGIAPLISKLNQLGLYTKFSCEGHGLENDGSSCPYIAFIDDYSNILDLEDPLIADYWKPYYTGFTPEDTFLSLYMDMEKVTVGDYMENKHISSFLKYLDENEIDIMEIIDIADDSFDEDDDDLTDEEIDEAVGKIEKNIADLRTYFDANAPKGVHSADLQPNMRPVYDHKKIVPSESGSKTIKVYRLEKL